MAFKELVSTTADFESALTGIQKKAGTTADETARLGKEALALSTSGELAVPLEEILSAMERGAAAGLPLDELREFARLSAMAADAFEMSAEEVGNAAAGFKVSMGISMGGMEEYFGLINKLADSGIADERDIVSFLDRAGAQLKLFGLSAEQAAAYGATLANIKMEPEVAARMMNTLTDRLLSPGSDKAAAALESIVGNIDAFQDILKTDANKAIEVFLDHVSELDKFEQSEMVTGLLGQGFSDEVRRLVVARDELARNQQIALDRASWKGSLGESYDLKLDDFWSQFQLLKNEFKKLTIDVGMTGMPAMKEALEGAREIAQEIGIGLENLKADVNLDEVIEAKDAVADLITEINSLMAMGSDNPPIQEFFANLATTVNGVASAVGLIKDGAQLLGLAEDDGDTASDSFDRLLSAGKAAQVANPIDALGRGFIDRFLGREDEKTETILKAGDIEPVAARTGGPLGVSTGATAVPGARPDPAAVAADVAKLQEIAGRSSKGSIEAPPLSYPTSSPFGGMPQDRMQSLDSFIDGPEEFRSAIEGAGDALALDGEAAGQSIAQGGAQLDAQGEAAGAAIRSAADYIAAQIRAALQTPVKVNMPSGGSLIGSMAGAPPSGNMGQSMPDAGIAGGQ
ncbi:phage tail tape measure protein [Aurantimonas sp. A2-1-M11]|uniref:phage tail tape measure protein n=1 Tax=Aurantimonas sp. A2-1-M11 TaxID=3113712 RepID=UPI002F94EE1A